MELDFEVGCAGLCEMFGGGELALVRVLERSGAKGRGAVSGVGPCSGVSDVGRVGLRRRFPTRGEIVAGASVRAPLG